MRHWKQIGISDEDVAELAARKQCHIGLESLKISESECLSMVERKV